MGPATSGVSTGSPDPREGLVPINLHRTPAPNYTLPPWMLDRKDDMTLCPFAVWRPVPSHSGPMQGHFGLVLHVQVGDNSCYGEFDNPANLASSTWWVSKSGVLEQYVDADMAAWTEAAGNFTWDSVETEGTPAQSLTAAQIATLARLYAWGHATYGWPYATTNDVNGRGFGWHGMGGVPWGNHPDCPGDLRKAQRQQILDLAQGSAPVPPAPTPTPTPVPSPLIEEGNMIARNTHGSGYWCVRKTGAVYAFQGAPALGPAQHYLTSWGIGTPACPVVGIADDGKGGFTLMADANQYPGVPALYGITADGKYKV
jgi:hypothetical protein